ncbi:MAG: aldo/keto reductase [Gammaproteobacteria bacterium]|nr:aldo/keto reductase [Gammaproteobacteria bacterium]
MLEESFVLANGVHIPKLGLGTWFINNNKVPKVVEQAIELGYRHIDTAQAYRNEAGVAAGIRASRIQREKMFVTTKLAAGAKTYAKATKSIDKSLKKMKMDVIDLMIIHSPQPWTKFGDENRYFDGNMQAWRALEDAYSAGKLRAIGVSNFQQPDLENIQKNGSISPMVNQVLAHIGNTPQALIDYCQRENILVQAYSPVAHGVLLNNDAVMRMANKYAVSVPQLCLRYDLQLGLQPLPKTVTPSHMKTNAMLDFVIDDADMDILKGVPKITDYGDASFMPVFGGKLTVGAILSAIFKRKAK